MITYSKIWKDLGGDQEEVLSIEKFGGYKTEVKYKNKRKGKASANKYGGRGEALRDIRGVE